MPETAAVGYGPIVYFTRSGTQLSLPVSAIYFDSADKVQARRPVDEDTEGLRKWLAYLVEQRRLSREVAPVPPPPGDSIVVTAKELGVGGDRLSVTVATPVSGGTGVEVTVSEIDRYPEMTVAALATTLGDGASPGTTPGVVRLLSVGTLDPVEGEAVRNLTATPPTWEVRNASGTAAFVLVPRLPATVPDLVTVRVDLDATGVAGPRKFTLTATWSKTVPVVTAGALGTLDSALDFVVDVDVPTPAKLPMEGTFSLRGGAEIVPAKAAKVKVPAKP